MKANYELLIRFFCLLFAVYFLLAFSSCISIEKRKYRDGFYVKQNIFHSKEKQREIVSGKQMENIVASDSLAVAAVENEIAVMYLLPSNEKPVFSNDYKLKTNYSLPDSLPQKKHHHKKNEPQKFDESKDATNKEKKLNIPSVIGFVFSVFSLSLIFLSASFTFFIPAVAISLCFSIVGVVISFHHKGKYYGVGFASIGLMFSVIACVLYYFLLLI